MNLFISNSNEPCCTQKYVIKKDGGTQAIISILLCIFEAHVLTVWKNTSMLMNPKIGWGPPMCMQWLQRALNSDFLIN